MIRLLQKQQVALSHKYAGGLYPGEIVLKKKSTIIVYFKTKKEIPACEMLLAMNEDKPESLGSGGPRGMHVTAQVRFALYHLCQSLHFSSSSGQFMRTLKLDELCSAG